MTFNLIGFVSAQETQQGMSELFLSPLMIIEQVILILGLIIGISGVFYIMKVKKLTVQSLNKLLGYFAEGISCFIIAMLLLFCINLFDTSLENILGFIGIALITIGFILISIAGKSLLKVISDVVQIGISREHTMIKVRK